MLRDLCLVHLFFLSPFARERIHFVRPSNIKMGHELSKYLNICSFFVSGTVEKYQNIVAIDLKDCYTPSDQGRTVSVGFHFAKIKPGFLQDLK